MVILSAKRGLRKLHGTGASRKGLAMEKEDEKSKEASGKSHFVDVSWLAAPAGTERTDVEFFLVYSHVVIFFWSFEGFIAKVYHTSRHRHVPSSI